MTKKQLVTNLGWAIALITLVAILTIALSVVSSGFKNWDVKTWFPKQNEEIVCEHEFENGVCVKCEEPETTCEHEFENGTCTNCGELELTE